MNYKALDIFRRFPGLMRVLLLMNSSWLTEKNAKDGEDFTSSPWQPLLVCLQSRFMTAGASSTCKCLYCRHCCNYSNELLLYLQCMSTDRIRVGSCHLQKKDGNCGSLCRYKHSIKHHYTVLLQCLQSISFPLKELILSLKNEAFSPRGSLASSVPFCWQHVYSTLVTRRLEK